LYDERKDHWAQIRISKDDDDLIKKFGGIKAEIWKIGFQKWLEDLPGKLKEKAEYHQKKYLQCIDKHNKCIDIVNTKKNQLDEYCIQYIKLGRFVPDYPNELTRENRNWIESKIKNKKLNCNIEGFIERCKELKSIIITNNTM
jgi:hypothetical protein